MRCSAGAATARAADCGTRLPGIRAEIATFRTAEVKVSGSPFAVTAATGANDNFAITRPSTSVLRVTDLPSGSYTGSAVHPGAGCSRSGDFGMGDDSRHIASVDADGISLAAIKGLNEKVRALQREVGVPAAHSAVTGGDGPSLPLWVLAALAALGLAGAAAPCAGVPSAAPPPPAELS